jgi:hypothetical protein
MRVLRPISFLVEHGDYASLTLNRFFGSIKEKLQSDRSSSQNLIKETWYRGQRVFKN